MYSMLRCMSKYSRHMKMEVKTLKEDEIKRLENIIEELDVINTTSATRDAKSEVVEKLIHQIDIVSNQMNQHDLQVDDKLQEYSKKIDEAYESILKRHNQGN